MMRLRQILEQEGIDDILCEDNSRGKYLDIARFGCDLYEMLDGNKKAAAFFDGKYMTDYSWAEERVGSLMEIKSRVLS